MTEMEVRVQEYLEADRQWTRNCRLIKARAEFLRAKSPEDKEFWKQIINANSGV